MYRLENASASRLIEFRSPLLQGFVGIGGAVRVINGGLGSGNAGGMIEITVHRQRE